MGDGWGWVEGWVGGPVLSAQGPGLQALPRLSGAIGPQETPLRPPFPLPWQETEERPLCLPLSLSGTCQCHLELPGEASLQARHVSIC